MADYIGTYSLVRQVKPSSRWKTPGVPSYDPNWVLKFYLPGKPVLVRSGPDDAVFPICDRCMALPAECGGVMKMRESCKCQVWPRRWAVEFLKTQTHLIMTGAVQLLQEMRSPEVWTKLKDVLTTYEQRGPSDAKKRANYLRTMIMVPTGKAEDEVCWADLTKGRVFEFAAMWQAAARKGWLERGAMPADGWARLRTELAKPLSDPTREVKAVDSKTVMACNTSIKNYLNSAKSIFGQWSRDNYLPGLKIPPLEGFLGTKVKVMVPKGHQEFTREEYLAILDALPELRRSNPRVWLVNQMLMRFALRPEEVFPARPTWLEEVAQGKKEVRTRINIVNREEEGFVLKAGVNAKPRHIWVPDDMLAVMQEVKNDHSLIGGRTATEARNLVEREHPVWLRSIGVDVERPNYKFRHFALAERVTSGDATKGAALGGHSTSATTEKNYARVLGTLEALSDAEIYRRLVDEE